MCFDILILTPHPLFFQVQCISKIQHACKRKIASWTIMPITIKVNSEMVLFDKIFINYWCKHYINNQISPNIHTVLIHQTISTIFIMQKKVLIVYVLSFVLNRRSYFSDQKEPMECLYSMREVSDGNLDSSDTSVPPMPCQVMSKSQCQGTICLKTHFNK